MITRRAIVEQWFARAAETYPSQTARFLMGEKDQFRNPVGHALRDGLAILLQQLLGDMDLAHIEPALDAIVRIRAVQDFPPSQAVGFVFLLKQILRELPAGEEVAGLDRRIDQLALMAFDKYMQCREQVAQIRAEERGGIFRLRRPSRWNQAGS
jgi:hypothetical protein